MNNDLIFTMWCWLRDTFGFKGATAFICGGLMVLIPLALYFIANCFKHYFEEEN